MSEEVINDIPHALLEAAEAGTVGEPTNKQVEVHSDGMHLRNILSFAGSCTINLVLPFVNGLMLGFGELLAHELCWRNNLFDRQKNTGYRIYPERRKIIDIKKDAESTSKPQESFL